MMDWVFQSLEKMPSFEHYRSHITTIVENIEDNPILSVELCKSSIEGVCVTILNDKSKNVPRDFNQITSATLKALDIDNHPDSEHLKELTKRMSGVYHYISTIRNQCNFASHGQDIEHKIISKDLAFFVVHLSNALLGFILHFYHITKVHKEVDRWRYEDYPKFNEYLDELYEEQNLGISYLLAIFDQDIQAYKEAYFDYENNTNNLDNGE